MKKVDVFKILFFAAALAVMVCIFVLSAQVATESHETSEGFIARLVKFFVKSFGNMSAEKQQAIIDGLQFAVRKLAHFSIFAALGIFLAGGMAFHIGMKPLKKYGISAVMGMLYAVSDEVHQYFVPGRSCELRDMCIDWLGVVLGTAVMMLIFYIALCIRRKKMRRL